MTAVNADIRHIDMVPDCTYDVAFCANLSPEHQHASERKIGTKNHTHMRYQSFYAQIFDIFYRVHLWVLPEHLLCKQNCKTEAPIIPLEEAKQRIHGKPVLLGTVDLKVELEMRDMLSDSFH